MKEQDIQKENLDGMYWTRSFDDVKIPQHDKLAIGLVWERARPYVVAETLGTLEHVTVTREQIQTMERGYSPTAMNMNDLMKTSAYLTTYSEVCESVEQGGFNLNTSTAKTVHGLLAKTDPDFYDLRQVGAFRTSNVQIVGVEYDPPESHRLLGIAEKGFKYLNERVSDHKERALLTFLFMSRSQFFKDINKRTASIMMNGELMKHNYAPFVFLEAPEGNPFVNALSTFYKTGCADTMIDYFGAASRVSSKNQR